MSNIVLIGILISSLSGCTYISSTTLPIKAKQIEKFGTKLDKPEMELIRTMCVSFMNRDCKDEK